MTEREMEIFRKKAKKFTDLVEYKSKTGRFDDIYFNDIIGIELESVINHDKVYVKSIYQENDSLNPLSVKYEMELFSLSYNRSFIRNLSSSILYIPSDEVNNEVWANLVVFSNKLFGIPYYFDSKNSKKEKKQMKNSFDLSCVTPKRINFRSKKDEYYTDVLWADGTVTVVKLKENEDFDEYTAFCAALAKKVFGSTNAVNTIVKKTACYPQKRVGRMKKSAKEERNHVTSDYLGNENASLSAYIEIETEHVCYDEVMYV